MFQAFARIPKRLNFSICLLIVAIAAVLSIPQHLAGQARTRTAARPIASEYNSLRRRANTLIGRLHSTNPTNAAKAQEKWESVLRDLEVWANKYHVSLATRTLTSTGPAGPLTPPDCKDLSNIGPDGSAAGDNSAGHCYLKKRSSQGDKYLCQYLCVPEEVIQQPDIDSSPYPSRP